MDDDPSDGESWGDLVDNFSKLPSFIKLFYSIQSSNSICLSPEWVRNRGEDLPDKCTLRYIFEIGCSPLRDLLRTGFDFEMEVTSEIGQPSFSFTLANGYIKHALYWNMYIGKFDTENYARFTVHYRTWDVVITKWNEKLLVHGGWKHFIRDNGLAVGVRCTFHLVSTNDAHFIVTFKR
ncbi:B3 domain-containing protein REM20-like [Salvia divinorum]|uniref:B3 domain-containing protein REM20-like n=1 Tax=Salvia divinorum TaxID=28513 RepID=A0ABD1IJL7_SALDI